MPSRAFLITGGAGFIGSHLAGRLLESGSVRVLDNLSPYYTGKGANLSHLDGKEGFEFVEGDVLDGPTLRRALDGVDVVFHLAAQPGVRASVQDPATTHRANVEGTRAVLEACRDVDITMLVNVSSSSVYGRADQLPLTEDMPLFPMSPYGASKAAAEAYCSAYHAVYDIPVVSLRYFTVYGPRQRPDMAIHGFTRTILAGGRPTVFGDGRQTRDYTYIDDIVAGTIAASTGGRPGEAYNLGGGHRIDVIELVRLIGKACGRTVEPSFVPWQTGDVQDTLADVSKATDHFGYRPRTAVEEGVRRFVAWYRERSPART
ncbi:MAG: GDP-mannose 4,6-dehydratase [Candidatus Undinarchaeales archaeon]|jgi:UDP-glucose 4-epimerase|nr:GDP-mannose 4,6-dehydratase [Candidatus Undinarchaeales archaeon]MDP7494460.1 GDP-mannose 4,6-dehydratase [Candidatus Undinarchaeales archaeon]